MENSKVHEKKTHLRLVLWSAFRFSYKADWGRWDKEPLHYDFNIPVFFGNKVCVIRKLL